MSENAVKKENWGSRIGYILSTLGMSIGVGAMWRFPMLTAKYGGGTFVLAFIIISIVAVIPAGWAESALGRKYKRSTAGNLEAVAGKKGRPSAPLWRRSPCAWRSTIPWSWPSASCTWVPPSAVLLS